MTIRLTRAATLLAASLLSIAWAGSGRAQDDMPAVPYDPVLDARAAAARADPAEALSRYLRILADRPRDLAALTGAGRAALDIGDGNAAIGFYARAEQVAPTDGKVKAGLAAALVQIGQPRAALKLFDQAVALGVPESGIAADRGLAWDLRGDPKRAQRDYALALTAGPNDETTRRMALSMGISGDRAGAMTVLDPLLRKQDKAAWRARAFIYALTGDAQSASDTVKLLMPSNQAAAIAPFLGKLATLKPAQKAMAVNFGQIPPDPDSDAKSRTQMASADDVLSSASPFGGALPPASDSIGPDRALIPSGKPFGRASADADADDGGEAAPPAPVEGSRTRRRPGRASEEFVVAPDVSRIGITSADTRSVAAPGRIATPSSNVATAERGAGQAARASVPASSGGIDARWALAANGAAVPPAASRTMAPQSAPATIVREQVSPVQAAADAAAARRAITAASSANAAPAPSATFDGKFADAAARAIAPPTPAASQQATVSAASPPQAGTVSRDFSGDDGASASMPVRMASSVAVTPAAKPAPPPATRPAAGNLASIGTFDLKAGPVGKPAAKAKTETPPTGKTAPVDKTKTEAGAAKSKAAADKADSAKSRDDPCADEAASKSSRGAKSHRTRSKCPADDSRTKEAEASKTKDKASASADESCGENVKGKARGKAKKPDAKCAALAAKDSKGKDGKAAKDKSASKDDARTADAKDKTSGSERYWVQVASGANKSDLGKEWDKVKGKSRLLAARTPSSAPWKASNRLVVGPFKTDEEAQQFVNQLGKQGVSGIQWTSRKGTSVEKLETK